MCLGPTSVAERHTPGPWVIDPGHSVVAVQTASGENIAATTSDNYWQEFTEETLANARLIAAAPELLEFAESVATFDARNNMTHLKEMARELVARATGAQ